MSLYFLHSPRSRQIHNASPQLALCLEIGPEGCSHDVLVVVETVQLVHEAPLTDSHEPYCPNLAVDLARLVQQQSSVSFSSCKSCLYQSSLQTCAVCTVSSLVPSALKLPAGSRTEKPLLSLRNSSKCSLEYDLTIRGLQEHVRVVRQGLGNSFTRGLRNVRRRDFARSLSDTRQEPTSSFVKVLTPVEPVSHASAWP